MDQVLSRIPRVTNSNVLVGFDTSDDAGVYRLNDECALVQTVDFFTPIVDDPFTFGAIAAANALSDIYAMGAAPLSALSIVAYPGKGDIDEQLAPPEQITPVMIEEGERRRAATGMLALDKRKGFSLVELGYEKAAAIEEAGRCLRCDLEEH